MRNERGSALIAVILVVLVLTMVGIAGMLFMTVEDQVAGTQMIQKEALFATESGLREGELMVFNGGVGQLDNWLLGPVTPPSVGLPSPGAYWDYEAEALMYGAQIQPPTALVTAGNLTGRFAFYEIYARNNMDDYGGSAVNDDDGRLNVVVRGWLQDVPDPFDPNAVILFEKVVEEMMDIGGQAGDAGDAAGGQTGAGSGGTGQLG